MKASFVLLFTLALSTSVTWAGGSIQCRGVDAHKEQIAIQVNEIENTHHGMTGSLRAVSLKGGKVICENAVLHGDFGAGIITGHLQTACDSNDEFSQSLISGQYRLNLQRSGLNTFKGEFCGDGVNTSVAGVALGDTACLKLSCLTRGLKTHR